MMIPPRSGAAQRRSSSRRYADGVEDGLRRTSARSAPARRARDRAIQLRAAPGAHRAARGRPRALAPGVAGAQVAGPRWLTIRTAHSSSTSAAETRRSRGVRRRTPSAPTRSCRGARSAARHDRPRGVRRRRLHERLRADLPGEPHRRLREPACGPPSLRHYDDWNALVVSHELAHVFHLDRAAGWWGLAQKVFGRSPILFPNQYLPSWVTEGLAIHYETKLTGSGRIAGTQHRAIARAAALDGGVPALGALLRRRRSFPAARSRTAYGGRSWTTSRAPAATRRVRRYVESVARTPLRSC